VSNSPLDQIIEHCGGTGKRIFIVDLYPSVKALPENLMRVLARRDEIIYSERIRKDVRTRETMHDVRRLITEILNTMEPMAAGQIKQRPHYIQVMGDLAPMSISRIIREEEDDDLPARDSDFSRKSVEKNKQQGYRMTLKVLGR
jgi:NTE family protein